MAFKLELFIHSTFMTRSHDHELIRLTNGAPAPRSWSCPVSCLLALQQPPECPANST